MKFLIRSTFYTTGTQEVGIVDTHYQICDYII